MRGMERIIRMEKNGLPYALLFCGRIETDAVRFLTQNEDELQVGVMERPTGYEVKPHRHPLIPKQVQGISEFLYIEKGRVQVQVYDDDWRVIGDQEMQAGDFLLFLRGGHGLRVLEPVRMIEVKQGPYLGDAKNKAFKP